MTTITIPSDYGYVVLVTAAMQMQVMAAGFAVGAARKKYGVKYPDMGSGRFSAKLSDKEWEDFNNTQRVHLNYLEYLTQMTTNVLLAGLTFPRAAAVAGTAFVVGRYLYGRGYVKTGPTGRMTGAIIGFLSFFTLFGMNVYGALKWLNYV